MAVMPLFKNLDRPLPVREQLDGLAHDLPPSRLKYARA